MVAMIEDPKLFAARRGGEIERRMQEIKPPAIDSQELADRMDATSAYASENEKHFVDYCQDCIDSSRKASDEIRTTWQVCYEAFKEKEPPSYANKEAWQARTVVPRPFQTVMYGASAVKKAFNPNFLTVENKKNPLEADFWQTLGTKIFDKQHANFPIRFTDACIMGLAIGLSLEMIPRWVPGKGLELTLVEPWKIARDPETISRNSQSGLYWIHQEWLDAFVLESGEAAGKYFDVGRAKDIGSSPDPSDPFMTKDAIDSRKDMIHHPGESRFRTLVLTNEFWGSVLGPKGEMLLPSGTYTVAGGRLIEKPRVPDYGFLRWPGTSFSPIPDMLRHGGRGLIQGILTIWQSMNTLMCLHQDNLIWVVNPMTEINTDRLVDVLDVNTQPGKDFLTREGAHGEPAIRTIERQSRTNEVLANVQFYDQLYQRGSFVPDNVQGLPGYRQQITAREAAMNLSQSMTVYSLMGENIEDGAVQAVMACFDVVRTYATWEDYQDFFTAEDLQKFQQIGFMFNPNSPDGTGIERLPPLAGQINISGIEALLKDNEALENIKTVLIPLANDPRFGKYIQPYPILKSLERRTALKDENCIVSEVEAAKLDQMEQKSLQDQNQKQDKMLDLQEALGITEIMEKMANVEKITAETSEQLMARMNEIEARNPDFKEQSEGSQAPKEKKSLQSPE